MKQAPILMLLAFVFLTCTPASSHANLRIAFIDVPPYAYLDKDGKESGRLIETFKQIAQFIGSEAEFIHLPHRRKIDFIEKGKVDIWAGQRDSRVKREISLISELPLFEMDLNVYWKAGTQPVSGFDELNNKRLILVSSFAYGGHYLSFAKNSQSIDFVINHESGFNKLFEGENKYFLGYGEIANEAIEKYKIKNWEKATLAKYALYLKVSKQHPNAQKIMDKVDAFLIQSKKGSE